MNQHSVNYPEFVAKLAANTLHHDLVPIEMLIDLIEDNLIMSENLDDAKKALFYGKVTDSIEQIRDAYPDESDQYIGNIELMHAIIGIRTEADELLRHLLEMLKGEPVSIEDLKDESGDLQWYSQLLANGLKTTMFEIIERNIVKLKVRYPDGFDEEKAKAPHKDEEALAQYSIQY